MNQPASIVDVQVRHLLEVVEQHRSKQCAKIQRKADKRARALINKAHEEGRMRAHDDFNRMRETSRRQLVSAQARLKTQKRLARQQSDEAFLQACWEMLKQTLEQKWQHADSRRQWVDRLADRAVKTLLGNDWCIEHPADWPDEERSALQQRLHEELGRHPEMTPAEDISTGLRLCSDDTCVDGTADGLLHDRPRVEAMTLAAIHKRDDDGHG